FPSISLAERYAAAQDQLQRSCFATRDASVAEADALERLRKVYAAMVDPIERAQLAQIRGGEAVDAALRQQIITAERAAELQRRNALIYRDQIDPLAAVNAQLDRRLALLSAANPVDRAAIQASQQLTATEENLLRVGVALSSQERQAIATKLQSITTLQTQQSAMNAQLPLLQRLRTLWFEFNTILLGFVGSMVIRPLIEMSDQMRNLQNRFAFVTGSAQGSRDAIQELIEVSARARTSFEGVSTIFTRTAFAAKQLGLDTNQLTR